MANKKLSLYSIYNDPTYICESIPCVNSVSPNENCVSDSEILGGKVVPSYIGTYSDSVKDGVHPLHRRGVDFTDVGDILAAIDADSEKTMTKIENRRKQLQKTDESPDKGDA